VETADLVRCPVGPPPHSGHLLLRWTRQGFNYAVSLHGDSPVNRDLLILIAERVYYVAP
jgi:hypothetical protein